MVTIVKLMIIKLLFCLERLESIVMHLDFLIKTNHSIISVEEQGGFHKGNKGSTMNAVLTKHLAKSHGTAKSKMSSTLIIALCLRA